jgi:hypothetical protein
VPPLIRSAPRSAPRTEAAENQFAFPKNAFAESIGGWPGEIEPLHVFHFAAAIADKMVMARAFRVITCGTSFGGHFAHQTGLDQVSEIVVGGGSRGARIDAIHGVKDFRCRRMAILFHQECHYRITLRSAAQAAVFERPPNLL